MIALIVILSTLSITNSDIGEIGLAARIAMIEIHSTDVTFFRGIT